MFQFAPFASGNYSFIAGSCGATRTAFPHSEIPGSKVVSTSPRLIAADHVLHRLSAPKHPPHTLSSLTTESLDPVINDWFVLPRPVRGGSRPRERPGARDRISVPLWNPCSHVKERGERDVRALHATRDGGPRTPPERELERTAATRRNEDGPGR